MGETGKRRKEEIMMEGDNVLTGDQCQVDIEFTDEYRSQLPSLIDEIFESCQKERAIANYESAMIPSKE